ncbi:MAG: ATP-binding cassette domain-containing protein [Proteobacteria bacterium]|nr:ATP-binding cassette domain-containing protein [Pseudomonadota bacterium]
MTALALTQISHAFGGTQVLHDVTLELSAGEVVCLLGPSGCGKTTTLRVAAGLEPVQTGTVSIDDQQVAGGGMAELAPEERRVGLVFQDYALFPHLTVLGNVAFGLRRLPLTERHRRARAVLEQVGMSHTAESYPHMLSGGERDALLLARPRARAGARGHASRRALLQFGRCLEGRDPRRDPSPLEGDGHGHAARHP